MFYQVQKKNNTFTPSYSHTVSIESYNTIVTVILLYLTDSVIQINHQKLVEESGVHTDSLTAVMGRGFNKTRRCVHVDPVQDQC